MMTLVALIPLITYAITNLQFQYALFLNRKRKLANLVIPVVPYWIPFLGHALQMALGSGAFVSKVT
jgi:hypothetical protein